MASRCTDAAKPLFCLSAFGAFFAWNALLYGVSPAFEGAAFVRICVPLLILCFWRRLTPLAEHHWLVWACALVGSASTMALYCPSLGVAVPPGLLAACELVGHLGVYTAQLILWSELFSGVPIRAAGMSLGIAYMFGPALYAGLALLPPQFLPGIAVCIPLALVPCFLLGLHLHPSPESAPHRTSVATRDLAALMPWNLILVMSCCSFAGGINRTFSTTEIDLASAAIAGLLVTLATVVLSRRTSVFTTYKGTFLVMIAALVTGTVLGGESVLSQVLLNVSQAFTAVLLMLYLCDKSFRFGIPAIFLVSLGKLCTLLAHAAGGMVSSAFAAALGGGGTAPTIILYGLTLLGLIAAIFLWLSDSGSAAQAPVGPNRKPTTSVASVSEYLKELYAAKCGELAHEYHLSARESEVLVLLAQGKNTRQIEECLNVSSNTVKTHTRHVYAKMGIHSRAELNLLLGKDL